jgi:flagellar protein FlbD
MVTLTRLNGSAIVVNADLIEMLETTPDTVMTLTTGKKLVVKESVEEVVGKVIDYKRRTNTPVVVQREEAES